MPGNPNVVAELFGGKVILRKLVAEELGLKILEELPEIKVESNE